MFVYFHIPKAAGTSVCSAIHKQFPVNNCLKVRALSTGGDVLPRDLGDVRTSNLVNKACCLGHFNIAQFRSNPLLMKRFEEGAGIALATVRSPAERLLSDYGYIKRLGEHPRKHEVSNKLAYDYAMEQPANQQMRWLDIAFADGIWRSNSQDALARRLVIINSDSVDTVLPRLMNELFGSSIRMEKRNVGLGQSPHLSMAEQTNLIRRNQADQSFVQSLKQSGGFWLGHDVAGLAPCLLKDA